MSDNVLAAAAVAAVPAEHRWCLRCLGWYLGELKTTHGIECTDVDFTCDHTPIDEEHKRCGRCRSSGSPHKCQMIIDSHWDLAREIIARRRTMLEFEKLNPHGGVAAADRIALKDSYQKVYKATHKYYKSEEETKSMPVQVAEEDQEFTPMGRPKRKAFKDQHWDWSDKINVEEDDYEPAPACDSRKRKKAQANETTKGIVNPNQENDVHNSNTFATAGTKEAAASNHQPALSHQSTPAFTVPSASGNQERALPSQATLVPAFAFGNHQRTLSHPSTSVLPTASFPAINKQRDLHNQAFSGPVTAVSQERALSQQATPTPGLSAAVNQDRFLHRQAMPVSAVPFAAAIASSVPGTQKPAIVSSVPGTQKPAIVSSAPGTQKPAIASSVPGSLKKATPSFSEYYLNKYPPNQALGGLGVPAPKTTEPVFQPVRIDNDNADSVASAAPAACGRRGRGRGGLPTLPDSDVEEEDEVQNSYVAPAAEMHTGRTPRRNATPRNARETAATASNIFATPAVSDAPSVPGVAASAMVSITEIAEEVSRLTAARNDAIRRLSEAVFGAIAPGGPHAPLLQDDQVNNMLQLQGRARQQ